VFFVCIVSWGCLPQTPTQRTFREKSFGNSKAFAKVNWCVFRKVFADFQGAFYKKPLEARFGTQFQLLMKNKKHGVAVFFVCIVSWGVCPKPGHKKLFSKSFLELQKLRQSKLMYFVRSSLAHLSPKERCVLLFTFLIRKVSFIKDIYFIFFLC